MARAITGGVETAYLGPEMTRQLDWWEASLTGDGWFAAGRFTAADIWLYVWLDFGESVNQPFDHGLPRIGPWFERVAARPSAALSRALLSSARPA